MFGRLPFQGLCGPPLKDSLVSVSATCWLQIWSGGNWEVPRGAELPQMIVLLVERTGWESLLRKCAREITSPPGEGMGTHKQKQNFPSAYLDRTPE